MHTGGYQGLSQTGTAPLVHYEVAVAGHTLGTHGDIHTVHPEKFLVHGVDVHPSLSSLPLLTSY